MNRRIDLSATFEALQGNRDTLQGKGYWCSLEELADSDAFQQLMQQASSPLRLRSGPMV